MYLYKNKFLKIKKYYLNKIITVDLGKSFIVKTFKLARSIYNATRS